jgi:hypothetical protein
MVAELFSPGQRNTAEEVAAGVASNGATSGGRGSVGVAAKALSFAPLIRKIEALIES